MSRVSPATDTSHSSWHACSFASFDKASYRRRHCLWSAPSPASALRRLVQCSPDTACSGSCTMGVSSISSSSNVSSSCRQPCGRRAASGDGGMLATVPGTPRA